MSTEENTPAERKTQDGHVLTAPEVAALEAIERRLLWPSLHWGVERVHPDAWPHIAIVAAAAALNAVRAPRIMLGGEPSEVAPPVVNGGFVMIPEREAFAIDVAHLDRQRAFSDTTFGPGMRTAGVLDHLRREVAEVEAAPDDLSEWADLIILAFDGATRRGHSSRAVLDAVLAKQELNETREWPDWRTQPTDRAIEHIDHDDRCATCAACNSSPDGLVHFMATCPKCGNKRCPAAMNHRYWMCSGSNAMGQIPVPLPTPDAEGGESSE